MKFGNQVLSETKFDEIVKQYGKTAIIHITGGEPSLVPWLYSYVESHKDVKFHLNTNAFIAPPDNVRRLKISFDSEDAEYFEKLVNRKGAFENVYNNIVEQCKKTVVSITCVLSKENYRRSPEFMKFCRHSFPGLYAVFFSIYKGNNERFKFDKRDIDIFFKETRPKLEREMDKESLALFQETIDEKIRLIQGIRFPENDLSVPCYLSLSERCFNWNGEMGTCSHLFRDGIREQKCGQKHEICRYGCNRRLVEFNQLVHNLLK
jgi:MoaA/NifB/PqqE/SkfB family radical SAM enzyme